MWKALAIFAAALAWAAAPSGAVGQQGGSSCTNVCSPRSQGTPACVSAQQECMARQQQGQASLLDQVQQPPGPVSYAGLTANISAQCQNVCSPRSQGTPACVSAQQECMLRQQQSQPPPLYNNPQQPASAIQQRIDVQDRPTQPPGH